MRKMLLLLRKYGFNAALIVLEMLVIIWLFIALAHYAPFLWIGALMMSGAAFLSLINRDTNPENKVTWLSVILLLPPLGALLYVMFSKRDLSRKERRQLDRFVAIVEEPFRTDRRSQQLPQDESALGKARSILLDDGNAIVYQNTDITYYPQGAAMYAAMLEDLRRAEHFIFLEFFIIEEGVMWSGILEILEEKAKAGLDVRVMYDDMGCAMKLRVRYDRVLRAKGISCYRFNPLTPDASSIHNNRDHRKILIVDGKIGYTGGINLADEYINHIQPYGHWKDNGVRLCGTAVNGLTRMFLTGWDMNSRTISDYASLCLCAEPQPAQAGYVIPFGSGPKPLYPRSVGKNLYLNLINQARRSLYITTPYLIIDYDLAEALQGAARRGVDVRMITPKISDGKIVHLMTRNSYFTLLQAGVKIYEYTPGFIHAKTLVCDNEYAVVGTINMDYRSFVHHFENGIWMYQCPVIDEIEKDFLDTLALSEEIHPDTIRMSHSQRALRDLIRLFAPLL